MTAPELDAVRLVDGVAVPQLGVGVFQVPPDDAQRVVEDALDLGYRHVDTAAAYVNEAGVGAALAASGLPREDVFVTSKLRNGDQGYDSTLRAYDDTCTRLGLEQLDLYLVHWPNPAAGRYADSWRALQRLHADGRVRAVGVSNFLVEHLDALDGVPAVNQVELHPTYQQRDLVAPAGTGDRRGGVLPARAGRRPRRPRRRRHRRQPRRDPAQVVLAWHLQSGHVVIPKSSRRERLAENLAAAELVLTEDELTAVSALDRGHRTGGDPATFSLSQIR